MKNPVLKYGLISGAVAAGLMVITGLIFKSSPESGMKYGPLVGYTGILISMLIIYPGVRTYRDQVANGVINFGRAFQVGILITIISCVCYVIAWFFVYHTLMPDFMEQYAAYSLKELQNSGASAEKIAAETQKLHEYKAMYQNPVVTFYMTFLEPFPAGLIVTLISALALRKNAA